MNTTVARASEYVAGTCYGNSCTAGHADSQDIVVQFSPGGTVLHEWVGGTPHGGVGPQDKPWIMINALTVDGTGNWYVTGLMSFPGPSLSSGVLEFSPGGKLLHRWRVPEAATPHGIAVPRGTVKPCGCDKRQWTGGCEAVFVLVVSPR